MSAPIIDYSDVVSILPLNWKADDEAFRYLLDGTIDHITKALAEDGHPMNAANISALHDAAWAHRAKYGRQP